MLRNVLWGPLRGVPEGRLSRLPRTRLRGVSDTLQRGSRTMWEVPVSQKSPTPGWETGAFHPADPRASRLGRDPSPPRRADPKRFSSSVTQCEHRGRSAVQAPPQWHPVRVGLDLRCAVADPWLGQLSGCRSAEQGRGWLFCSAGEPTAVCMRSGGVVGSPRSTEASQGYAFHARYRAEKTRRRA